MYKYYNSESRFAEEEEVLQSTKQINITNKQIRAGGLPIKSNGRVMHVDNEDVRTLTIASSGAGKSRRVIMPMILTLAKSGSSMVVHDPKGELLSTSYFLLQDQGYDIKIINFRNPLKGDCYNPLQYPVKLYKSGQVSKAIEYFFEFAYSLYEPVKSEKDPFWTNTSENYLTGLCKLACELMQDEQIDIASVYNLHVAGNDKVGGTTYLKEYFSMKNRKNGETWRLLESTVDAPSDTKASILSVMSQTLNRLVANKDMVDLLSGEMDWNIEDIGRKKMAVFLLTKDEGALYNSIVSAIIQQIYIVLIELADYKYQGKLPRRVEMIMDEFGNMAQVQDINEKITASRSRNIRWHLVIQSLEQLWLKYSKEEAKILLGNCEDWLYMFSSDRQLVDYISERCGEKICEYTGERQRLLSVATLQHLNKEQGECLVLQGRNYPYITYLPDISQYSCQYPRFDVYQIKDRKYRERKFFDFQKIVNVERNAKIDAILGRERPMSEVEGTII